MTSLWEMVEDIESKIPASGQDSGTRWILQTSPGELDILLTNEKYAQGKRYYSLNFCMGGPERLSRSATVEKMREVVRRAYFGNPAVPDVDWSELTVTLRNGQKMELEHHYVGPAQLHHYIIDFYLSDSSHQQEKRSYQREKRKRPISLTPFAELVQKIYGLHLNTRYDPYHHRPFREQRNLRKGVSVSTTSKLQHGTIYEQKAYQALHRHRRQFSRQEWKTLRKYDSALVERKDTTNHERGILLQERKDDLTPVNFLSGLRYLPSAVQSLTILLNDDERFMWISSEPRAKKTGKPSFSFHCSFEEASARKVYLREFLQTYAGWHDLNVKELRQVVEAGRKEGDRGSRG